MLAPTSTTVTALDRLLLLLPTSNDMRDGDGSGNENSAGVVVLCVMVLCVMVVLCGVSGKANLFGFGDFASSLCC